LSVGRDKRAYTLGSLAGFVKIVEGEIRNDNRVRQGAALEQKAIEIMRRIGIKNGQTVLDFGCGSGTYTIPVAKIVGKKGKVYALDKDKNALDNLMKRAELGRLKNIGRMATSGELRIELPDESVDITLLFDVFHRYYVPQISDRKRLLDEIYRITKTEGFVSVWPKHMETEVRGEIEAANFYLEDEFLGTLIHDNKDIETGKVINFRKKSNRC
jgi:ubiquinone/menaquinone biosynthesis C-methylase UbiE